MHISIKADVAGAQRFLREIGDRGIRRAAARAINDTLTTIRAEGARAIRREHPALKVGEIKNEMIMRKANAHDLRGWVQVTGRPFSLKMFRARETSRGVSARVGKGRQALVIHHGRKAFIVKAYGEEIFVRKFANGRQLRRYRGPSMPGIFRARQPELKKIANAKFPKAFISRLQYEIEQARRKAASA